MAVYVPWFLNFLYLTCGRVLALPLVCRLLNSNGRFHAGRGLALPDGQGGFWFCRATDQLRNLEGEGQQVDEEEACGGTQTQTKVTKSPPLTSSTCFSSRDTIFSSSSSDGRFSSLMTMGGGMLGGGGATAGGAPTMAAACCCCEVGGGLMMTKTGEG